MEVVREGELHPIQNSLILEHILKMLTVNDLKVCRLVCQEWREIATKAMHPISKVRISCEDRKGRHQLFLNLVQDNMSNFSESPFATNFELRFAYGFELAEFFSFCGRHIKQLTLNSIEFFHVKAFRDAIFASCPNISKLVIRDVWLGERTALGELKWKEPVYPVNYNLKELEFHGNLHSLVSLKFFVELFAQYPSLEYINVDTFGENMDIFKSLRLVRNHDKNLCKLKRLKCNFQILSDPHAITSVLEDDDIALETFEAKWMTNVNDVMVVKRIWEGNSDSLKHVHLRRGNGQTWNHTEKLALPIPENRDLKTLEELSLVSWELDSLSFLRSIPNIKTLCLFLAELRDIGDISDLTLPNCTELTVSIQNSAMAVEVIRKFGECFPNLEKLRIFYANNEIFALICEFWPKLKCLDLELSKVDDAGICGWDSEDVNGVNRDEACRPITVPRANLASLQDLQNFRHLRRVRGARLGYCAAVYGVMLLPELRHLYVPNDLATGRVWDDLRLRMAPKEEFRRLFDDVGSVN